MEEKIIQITSGKGPAECERVVYLIFEKLKRDAVVFNLKLELIEKVEGNYENTFLSVLLKISGDSLTTFRREWEGSIQWIGPSPFRKFHKRKNWFIGVVFHEFEMLDRWDEKDFTFQTLKSSGPGGQNVNKVESAVRAMHTPSGLSVTASNERSQYLNKKEATSTLKKKLDKFLELTKEIDKLAA